MRDAGSGKRVALGYPDDYFSPNAARISNQVSRIPFRGSYREDTRGGDFRQKGGKKVRMCYGGGGSPAYAGASAGEGGGWSRWSRCSRLIREILIIFLHSFLKKQMTGVN